jgi:hypothetical protein
MMLVHRPIMIVTILAATVTRKSVAKASTTFRNLFLLMIRFVFQRALCAKSGAVQLVDY